MEKQLRFFFDKKGDMYWIWLSVSPERRFPKRSPSLRISIRGSKMNLKNMLAVFKENMKSYAEHHFHTAIPVFFNLTDILTLQKINSKER
jgi:hypothetical protein